MKKFVWCAALVATVSLSAQTPGPAGTNTRPETAQAAPAAELQNRTPTFPAIKPEYFTAASPTVDTVNAFLKALWGYDQHRVWSVQAILATKAPGVAKVIVLVGDTSQPAKTAQTVFFTMPDGTHAIADGVIDFGPAPFATNKKLMEDRADGPARGAAGKQLLLVEFSDMQCPHCRDAQAIIDQLATDFPQARIVFQNFPLSEIHPAANEAAAEGLCVRATKGDAGFFKFASSVFEQQEALTPDGSSRVFATAAVKAGADAAATASCAKDPRTQALVSASVQFAKDAGVDSTPTLFINGFPIPMTSVPYEVLKKIVVYQANLAGMKLSVQPSLKTLK